MSNIHPEAGIIAVHDNGGETSDRYSIHVRDRYGHPYTLLASDNQMPNGIFMIGDYNPGPYPSDGPAIPPETLPPQVRRKVRGFILMENLGA